MVVVNISGNLSISLVASVREDPGLNFIPKKPCSEGGAPVNKVGTLSVLVGLLIVTQGYDLRLLNVKDVLARSTLRKSIPSI